MATSYYIYCYNYEDEISEYTVINDTVLATSSLLLKNLNALSTSDDGIHSSSLSAYTQAIWVHTHRPSKMTICQATICEVVKFLWFKSPEVLWGPYSTHTGSATIRTAWRRPKKRTTPRRESLIQSLAVLHRILSTSQQCLLRFEAQFSKAVDHVGDLRGKNQLHKLWQDIATLPSAKIHTSFVSTDQKNRSTECIMTFGTTFGDTALPQQQSLTYDIIWHMTILIHIQVCVQINKISINIPENWRSWLQICDTKIFAFEKPCPWIACWDSSRCWPRRLRSQAATESKKSCWKYLQLTQLGT